jgi:hypothetical protein
MMIRSMTILSAPLVLTLSACGSNNIPGSTDGGVTNTTAAAGTAVPAAAAGAISARATRYSCVFFSGSVTGGGRLVSSPGFSIASDGTYTHDDGTSGTVSMTADTIEFHGGALDGQAAKYEDNGGKGVARLYNEDRSRTVIDCEGA